MFNFPSKTEVQQKLKMNDIFKIIKADKTIKTEAQNILQIALTNVLSETTTGLNSSEDVKEIYVIRVILKTNLVPKNFLSALDKSIHFQVLYILENAEKVKFLTGYKTIKDKITISKVFESDWKEEMHENLPLVSNLSSIYKAILEKMSNLKFRQNENIKDWQERFLTIEKLEKEFKRIEKLLYSEKQPKMQFEYNEKLRKIYNEIVEIKE